MASTDSVYPYRPSHVAPIVFAAIIGLSLVLHVLQNFRYRFWRITFFMVWGGLVFTTGWILRCISTYHPDQLGIYIAQNVCIYAGPPIYSAAEYNTLVRLMYYLPMYTPLHPGRLLYFFIYLGALVESLTAAGASLVASAKDNESVYTTGGTLITIGLFLQAAIECVFMGMVALLHYRCERGGRLPRNVRTICVMLYGTSTLILLRCIYRAIEAVATFHSLTTCGSLCRAVLRHEWYLYAFEATPVTLYTIWLNAIHPGRFLPRQKQRYLDLDRRTERLGPGWIDRRSKWETFADPFDWQGLVKGQVAHDPFWLRPDDSQACEGSFATKSATNVAGKGR